MANQVDEFLEKKNHPLTREIQQVRTIILDTHPEVDETIKWSSPTFMYKGNIAPFYFNAKRFVSLFYKRP